MEAWQRTDECGALRAVDIGRTVTVNGWVNAIRDHGQLVFIDLRDRTGLVQVRAGVAQTGEGLLAAASAVRPEYVLSVTGEVRARCAKDVNPRLPTGEIEVDLRAIEVLCPSRQPLPFQLSDEAMMAQVNEELRLRHRYLDLRRPRMQEMLQLRHDVVTDIRAYLNARAFLEIETPILTKSTPEGARDYLVPYRLEPGLFYALPQSPQQYKQLLMVSGCERYYQIARSFRDEAQRADRQPEFTQLDLEMSFVTQEDIMELAEGLTIDLVTRRSHKRLGAVPFTRLTYDQAIARFGSDKPDLRIGLELADVGEAVRGSELGVFRAALESGGQVKALRYPGGASLSRKEIDDLTGLARDAGAKGLAHLMVDAAGVPSSAGAQSYAAGPWAVRGSIGKFLAQRELEACLRSIDAEPGDLALFVADKPSVVAAALGRLRVEVGRRLALADPDVLHFCWITDFPLVLWDEEQGGWDAAHHPFTMPHPEDLALLESDPGRVRAQSYDIVCNGVEWASGSIRVHREDIQERVFGLLGISPEAQRQRFGHMLAAFSYGAPPHGGIGPGIDRLLMLMTGTDNIREVMAFPKMGEGFDPMMGAPSPVDPAQLDELRLRIVERETTSG
ncbi:MAG TPA: aspartate--tRNA ligase [Chthonomonadales bacterium]|nr:aspartate--tRNA ligase [Chthonomonadales bacterium]